MKLNENVISYFEGMINNFCDGNENDYELGSKVSFLFEEIEKGVLEYYDKEDVDAFFNTRDFIKNEGGEVKYVSDLSCGWDGTPLEYTFKVVGNDIECSWIEK